MDVNKLRRHFPALARTENGRPVVFADGPAGTQVPRAVIDAMAGYLRDGLSNLGGSFTASRDSGTTADGARSAVADLVNCSPREVAFGQNMTSITFAASRAISSRWSDGDNVVVTRLDHDANITPWMTAAADRGAQVRFCDFDPADGCRLDMDDLMSLVDRRTRLVAVTHASNAVGTVVDVARVADVAHSAGALVYVDAVHASPHLSIDVQQLDCDFLTCSAYKFFGPHTGILYGKQELLDDIRPVKIRPAPDESPESWETGTQSFESLAGVEAAIGYLAAIGGGGTDRRSALEESYGVIAVHESGLAERFLTGVAELPRLRLFGSDGSVPRVSTFALAVDGSTAAEAHHRLATEGIYTWAGHYYAIEVMRRLDIVGTGGLLRIGFVHYNTMEEVDRVLQALAHL